MFTVRIEDESDLAVSKAPTEEVFTLPDQENLRFIADRLAGLIEEGK